jgi:hypothetical protein
VERRITFAGFDEALVTEIGNVFRFSTALFPANRILVPGVHLFLEDLPEVDDIRATADSQNQVYDEQDPVLAFFAEGVPGVAPSISSGARLEWLVRVVIRYGTVSYRARTLLEDLYAYLIRSFPGRKVGSFMIKNVIPSSMPVGVYYEGDKHAMASATLRFMGVALNT